MVLRFHDARENSVCDAEAKEELSSYEREARQQLEHDKKEAKALLLHLFMWTMIAAIWGVIAWMLGHTLHSYERDVAWIYVVAIALWILKPLEVRDRTKEIQRAVKEMEKTTSALKEDRRELLERMSTIEKALIDAKASMHEYLAERAAWETTKRLDGRTDDESEREYNPESHDLVVKGIKCTEAAEDYEWGKSVPQDQELAEVWYRRAVGWYELAAGKGDSYAQEKLGDIYFEGRGVQRDDAKALNWWRLSAHGGRVSAQFRLGTKYYLGKNVEKNLAEALFWFDIVLMSHPAGFIRLKREAASYRDHAVRHLTPAELSREQERARKWFEEHSAKPQ